MHKKISSNMLLQNFILPKTAIMSEARALWQRTQRLSQSQTQTCLFPFTYHWTL